MSDSSVFRQDRRRDGGEGRGGIHSVKGNAFVQLVVHNIGTCRCCVVWCFSRGCSHLEFVNISWCCLVTDDGVRHLVAKCTNIQYFLCKGCVKVRLGRSVVIINSSSSYYPHWLCRTAWVERLGRLFVCQFVRSITYKWMIPKCSNLVQEMTLGYTRSDIVLGLKGHRVKLQWLLLPC